LVVTAVCRLLILSAVALFESTNDAAN
jgi:hypothetical protein